MSSQSTEEIPHQRNPIDQRRRAALDANAILPMEADAAISLHQQDQIAGIKRRLLHELECCALRPGVDLGDAQLFRGEAQAMTGQECLRGLGRGAECGSDVLAAIMFPENRWQVAARKRT